MVTLFNTSASPTLMIVKQVLRAVALLLLISSCHSKKVEDTTTDVEDIIKDGEFVVIPEASPLNKKIKLERVTLKPYERQIVASAEIEADPTKMAKINPPLSGRILKIYVVIGQRVKEGQILFSMDAPDFVVAQKDYLSSRQEVNQAQINVNRQNDLLEHGVGIKKEAQEAQTDLSIKQSELSQTIARLKLYGINPDDMRLGAPLLVKAPVEGDVISINMTPGQFKNDPTEVLLTVADLSPIWFTANVKEKDIRFIEEGESAAANVTAYPEKTFTGKVLFVNDVLDQESHSLKVRTEVENKEGLLKPGMYATVTFSAPPEKDILIPAKAILQKEDETFVYVQVAKGRFQKRVIETEETIGDHIRISDGLKDGEVIVGEGAFYLIGNS